MLKYKLKEKKQIFELLTYNPKFLSLLCRLHRSQPWRRRLRGAATSLAPPLWRPPSSLPPAFFFTFANRRH
jgi:hypothetical protein